MHKIFTHCPVQKNTLLLKMPRNGFFFLNFFKGGHISLEQSSYMRVFRNALSHEKWKEKYMQTCTYVYE